MDGVFHALRLHFNFFSYLLLLVGFFEETVVRFLEETSDEVIFFGFNFHFDFRNIMSQQFLAHFLDRRCNKAGLIFCVNAR